MDAHPEGAQHKDGKAIGELIGDPDAFDAQCKRMSGWSLQEWDEVYQRRRSQDVRRGKIKSGAPLTHQQMQDMMIQYGFESEDFYAATVPTKTMRTLVFDFKPPTCPITQRTADNVIRWFLKPDRIPV